MLANRLLAPLLLVATSALAEDIKLTLRIDDRPIDAKHSAIKATPVGTQEAETATTIEVTIGHGFVKASRPGNTTVLDFARRLRVVETKSDGATVSSLFAGVGGREREMENRKFLDEVMEKSGAGTVMPLALSEHNLSMRAEPPARGVTREEKGGIVRFRWLKVQIGEYTKESLPLTDAERDAFLRFVRYELGGHPQLLEDLAKTPGIPRRLKLVDELSFRTRDITVVDFARQPDAAYEMPSGATTPLATDPRWGPLAKRASATTPDDVQAYVQGVEMAADAAFEAGKPAEAFLLYVETNLAFGVMPAGLKKNVAALNQDAMVKRIRGAITPKSAEEAKKSLITLAEVRAALPAFAHVLRIFEGNINSNLGDEETAFEHFHAVLSARPAIAGVWHDLGTVFLNDYNAEAAWSCWDIARRIAPEHGLVKTISEREANLVAKYPEFF